MRLAPRQLAEVARCPNCHEETLAVGEGGMVCACGMEWPEDEGVYRFQAARGLPLPAMYGNPHYQAYMETAATNHDYFYNASALVRWVQLAGHRAVRRLVGVRRQDLVLDLGCGVGPPFNYLDKAAAWLAVDGDFESLTKLAHNFPSATPIQARAENLPLRSGVVDRAVAVYCLEHLIHLDFTLEEVCRVLKPNGYFVASIPCEGGLAWSLGRRFSSARHFGRQGLDYIQANRIDHCNTSHQVERALRRHFRVVRRLWFPWGGPSMEFNLVVTYLLRPL